MLRMERAKEALRAMGEDDRRQIKSKNQKGRNGMFEDEAEESGSDFSDDDNERSAENRALEALKNADDLEIEQAKPSSCTKAAG